MSQESEASSASIRNWYFDGLKFGAVKMLIVHSREIGEIFPVFAFRDEDCDELDRYHRERGCIILEIYDLCNDIDAQLEEKERGASNPA